MEEIFDETKLPAALRGNLVRERALMHRLAARNSTELREAVDVCVEPTERSNTREMVFRGVNKAGKSFRITVEMYRRGRSQWFMRAPRVFVDDVENEGFEGDLEDALAAALEGSNERVGETQGVPAVNARGARSNAVETRRATVIRN